MATKKSKTVKKASKSSASKKKKAPVKKVVKKKVTRKAPARKKAAVKKAAAKKSAAKKKTPAKKAPVKKAPVKKASAKKAPARKAAPKNTAAKGAKKKVVKKQTVKKKVVKKKTVKKKAVSKRVPRRSATTSDTPIDGAVVRKAASPAADSTAPGRNGVNGVTHHNGDSVEWTIAKLRKVKTGLTRKDHNYFRKLLLERRAEIVGDVNTIEAARTASDGDISHVPLHMADAGSDNFEQEFNLGLMESERRMVLEIDSALERIQNKIYGVCLGSGQPIRRERLEIKPWAKYTIDVVRDRERRGLPL